MTDKLIAEIRKDYEQTKCLGISTCVYCDDNCPAGGKNPQFTKKLIKHIPALLDEIERLRKKETAIIINKTSDGEYFCPCCHEQIAGYYASYCEYCGQAVGFKDEASPDYIGEANEMTGMTMPDKIKVTVRWQDGYLEDFDATEVRFGSDLLWMRLTDERNRHIPLRSVRWFSQTPESHERSTDDANS